MRSLFFFFHPKELQILKFIVITAVPPEILNFNLIHCYNLVEGFDVKFNNKIPGV